MKIITMEHDTDCEVAAIATACQVSYDKAETALGWRKLPFGAENPIFGNSLNLHRALLMLGHWKINRTFNDIISSKCTPGKTVILVKKSVTKQHWCVLASAMNGIVGLYMGREKHPNYYTNEQFKAMFICDGPVNEAFEVYKIGFLKLIYLRFSTWFKNLFKG